MQRRLHGTSLAHLGSHAASAATCISRAVRPHSRGRIGYLGLVARRTLWLIPTLLFASLLPSLALSALPGSAAQQLLGSEATHEQVAAFAATLNIDRTPWEQYADWLRAAAIGDLGTSPATGQRVTELLGDRLSVTFQLASYAFALALGFAVPVALLCARRPRGFIDRTMAVINMVGLSAPNFVLSLLLVFVFAVTLRAFPAIGYTPLESGLLLNLRSLTLPAISIAFPLFCFYTRFLRGDLVEQLESEDYLVTASAKGLRPWQVLLRHALPNCSSGLLTVVGVHVGTLISGMVIVEQIFALPGVGHLLVHAIHARDVVVVQAIVTLVTLVVVAVNCSADILHAVLDPRVRDAIR